MAVEQVEGKKIAGDGLQLKRHVPSYNSRKEHTEYTRLSGRLMNHRHVRGESVVLRHTTI